LLNSLWTRFWRQSNEFLAGFSAATGIALNNSIGNLGGFVDPCAMGAIIKATGGFSLQGFLISAMLLITLARHFSDCAIDAGLELSEHPSSLIYVVRLTTGRWILFVTQGHHRIDPRCATSWEVASGQRNQNQQDGYSSIDRWSPNFRLRYHYRPGSDLYIIFNDGTQFANISPANPSQMSEASLRRQVEPFFRARSPEMKNVVPTVVHVVFISHWGELSGGYAWTEEQEQNSEFMVVAKPQWEDIPCSVGSRMLRGGGGCSDHSCREAW
jgi:hypothetical protein